MSNILKNNQYDTNLIYIYDLPKASTTSIALSKIVQEKTGLQLNAQPQIRRDPNKPFYSALIKIDNPEKFQEVAQKLRYFKIDGKPCRALPYTNELLGANVAQLQEHNMFVRKIPKDVVSDGLEEFFKGFGDIISCKVSFNEDHSSRGYGFVCFRDPQSANQALQKYSGNQDQFIAVKFAPKSKADFRKVFNNIFVKDMPDNWGEAEIRKAFEAFGQISSLFVDTQKKHAFVCYGNDNINDREYGPKCAAEACE
jgi:RNA recognition motif-containing protein